MWPRGNLSLGWSDLFFGEAAASLPLKAPRQIWPTPLPHAAFLSVRSAWDAFLTVANWPSDGEILVSQVTIPGMVEIIEAHGLRAVPIPLDRATLEVSVEATESHITPRTKAILVAPIFGSRMPLQKLGKLAQSRRILLVEDAAQAFCGAQFRGSPEADLSFFSFGPIKTATALGGAIVFAREKRWLDQMRAVCATYPLQTQADFRQRLRRGWRLKLASQPALFEMWRRSLAARGVCHDAALASVTRSFALGQLIKAIRHRPAPAQLRLLARRLSQNIAGELAGRKCAARHLSRHLNRSVLVGQGARPHSHWIFPVQVARREELVRNLWRAGFDANCRASSLVVLETQNGGGFDLIAERLVYLPCYRGLPFVELERMAEIVNRHCV